MPPVSASTLFQPFTAEELQQVELPAQFTFPFFYQPHPLALVAADHLKTYLQTQTDFEHNFGLELGADTEPIGKMFGVLVVRTAAGEIGYLCGVSGKLGGTNEHTRLVPPVFDMLQEQSFFLKGVEILNTINAQVEAIATNPDYLQLKSEFEQTQIAAQQAINEAKATVKQLKNERKALRAVQKPLLTAEAYAELEADLVKQSLRDKHEFNVLSHEWNQRLQTIQEQLAVYEQQLEHFKEERKTRSSALQEELFQQYSFLNQRKEYKSLHAIFKETVFGKPPAAAGECATPKLLHYAYQNDMYPLAMAEFWWGESPKSEVRRHGQFYPACTGKCEPILKHMLQGLDVAPNPFLTNWGADKKLEIVYEDEQLVVVNKPHDLLSVPGINVQDSVYTRLKAQLSPIEPLIIHRLDMPTSGLLVVAKTKMAHQHIQRQFLTKRVKKRYTALLSRPLATDEGEIDLPLALDIINRPMQKVCFETGKKAQTRYRVVERTPTQTRIHFWPLTGRTHQLRMHAAHQLGLHAPIVGDDLYGTPSDRLYLHAAYLEFQHPYTGETVIFEVPEAF